jgi:predicted HTH transcriptional regulator
MNSEGGTLVVGVEDDGNVIGLDHDLKILDKSTDKFIRTLASAINDNIGGHSAHLYKIRIEKVNGESVCVVDVERSPEPVFANSSKASKEFYIRVGNTTRAINAEETHRYIESRWQ